MKKKRLLVLILTISFFLFYTETVIAVEENAKGSLNDQASSHASIKFLNDNTQSNQKNLFGDLGIGEGKRLPNTGEMLKLIWISFGYIIVGLMIFFIMYKCLFGDKKCNH